MPNWSPGVKERLQAGPTRYIRGMHGERVHLWDCPHRGKWWVAWKWAEGRSWSEIAALDWVKPCKLCRPEQNTDTE